MRRCFVEETELDEGFAEARERLERGYFAAVTQGKDPDKVKLVFDREYKSLIVELQKRQAQLYESRRRNAALKAPFARYASGLKLVFKRLSDKWDNRGHPIKKWRFERKIKRILKDKSDL